MRTTTKERAMVAKKLYKKPKGKLEPINLDAVSAVPNWMTRAYKNNRYIVMINDHAQMTNGVTAIKAMVQRLDNTPIPRHWSEMQEIKNELFGSEAVGIEYYPAESELENTHNIYWLWILPEEAIPVAVRETNAQPKPLTEEQINFQRWAD